LSVGIRVLRMVPNRVKKPLIVGWAITCVDVFQRRKESWSGFD